MIDLISKNYSNILSGMLKNVPNLFDKREGSIIKTALGPASYALEEFYLALNQVQASGYVQTAVGQSLDYLAEIAGLTRSQATAAVRLGIFNQPVPLGARFSTINGANSINFVVTAETDVPNQYQLTAETVGPVGNAYIGSILPITYIEGLTTAQITDILVPGDDIETDDALRERLIIALNEQSFGGNVASYREEIMKIDGVGGVQIYPTWNGGGTVKCAVLGADLQPASEVLLKNVQHAIDPPPNQGLGLGLAPIGAKVTIVAPAAVTINVSAKVTLAPGYDIGQIQPQVEDVMYTYLQEIRGKWDDPTIPGGIEYTANIYIARVISAILEVQGVLNTTNVTLNDGATDIILTETGTTQQVPILGTVTLNVATS